MTRLSPFQSFGVKLLLLGGTLGCLFAAGVLMSPPQAPHAEESTVRQPDADPSASLPEEGGPDNAATGVQMDLNQSSVEELQTLPGIGVVLAERIRHYRDKHGQFTSIEEITQVKGIGVKRFERLRPYIGVKGVAPNG